MRFGDVNPGRPIRVAYATRVNIANKVSKLTAVATVNIERTSRRAGAEVMSTIDTVSSRISGSGAIVADGMRVVFTAARNLRMGMLSVIQRSPFAAVLPRLISFSSVGGFIAVLGLVLQYALVRGLGLDKHVAYLIQSVVSIELNFFINNFFTWHDRRTPGIAHLGKAWLKFHMVRVFTVTFNQMLYAALLFVGMQYLVANVVCVFVIMVINYWSGDKFIFAAARTASLGRGSAVAERTAPGISPSTDDDATRPESRPPTKWLPRRILTQSCPSVSVVIPVKQSQRTIEATVASLLQQEYAGPVEIIIVGDKDDSTWIPLRSYIDAGLLTIVETEVHQARHDLNAKRNAGLQHARGQVLALVESDMLLPSNWIASGVEYIRRGWPCVVGSVSALHNDLASAYAATRQYYSNSLASFEERVVDMERLGAPGYQLPITSNIFLSRDTLYYIDFPDPDFDAGYEGYQWQWEIAQADAAILSVPKVVAIQQNRRTWRQLLKEYVDSGQGCADFLVKHPRAELSRRRLGQLIAVTLGAVALGLLIAAGLALPDWPRTIAALVFHHVATQAPTQSGRSLVVALLIGLVTSLLCMGMYSAWQIRHVRGLVFPMITVGAGAAFTVGVARGLAGEARKAWRHASVRPRVRFDVVNTVRQSISMPPQILAEDAWSVSGPQVTGMMPALVRESRAPAWPSVSVVIPVKRSQATIAPAVESLLRQDYKGDIEILLVGDKNDPTWGPIRQHIDSGRISIIEAEIHSANRDANAKRSIGLNAAKGKLLSLTDSDMVLPTNWVSTGVEYILKGWPCVAGPMRGARGDFWDSYADLVDLGSKTPRFGSNIIVDRSRFGQPYHKPPITANVFFTRTVMEEAGDFDPAFTHSYEDYSWFWTVCRAGIPILCTPDLIADHYHRQGWRQLVRQYTRAGRGCGDFVLKYPESPLSQARLLQLVGVWSALLAVIALMLGGIAASLWPFMIQGTPLAALASRITMPFGILVPLVVILTSVMGLLALGARNALSVRRPIAIIYPFITMVFALSFSVGLTDILLRAAKRWVLAHRTAVATGLAFGGIICAALVLRVWNVTIRPGFEWDEPVYANVSWNLAHTGLPSLRTEVQHRSEVYFSQPPLYFVLLALWYKVTNTTQAFIIGQARLLSALVSVGMIGSIFLLLRRRIGSWALVPTLIVAVDGWIVFANRISWIDNVAIPIGIVGLWAYDRACAQERRRPFILAGGILALAILFKYLAVYFCLAVAINWLITRQRSRQHVAVMATVALIVLGYALIATIVASALTPSGHMNTFIAQHLHQLLRVTNRVSSRGNVMSLQQVFAALVRQYRIFVLTVGLCGLGGAFLAVDVARCAIRRDLSLLRQHSLETSWALAAILIFGAVQMKFINYFEYVMIALLVYVAVRTIDVVQPWLAPGAPRSALMRVGLAGLLVAVVCLDLVSFVQRIPDRSDNTFANVQAYASLHIPATAEVVTEQPIGTMLHQPYCQLVNVANCTNAKWVILFVSLTQKPPANTQLQSLLTHATLRETYQGFKETVYIYQIR